MAISNEYLLKRAEAELKMLQEDCEIFGAVPEDIVRMNSLKAYIEELTNQP